MPRQPGRPAPYHAALTVIDGAIAGKVAFRALTTAERRMVVYYLATVERLSDLQVADRLRWSPNLPPVNRRNNVAQFRHTWRIPAGYPQPTWLPAGRDDLVRAA